VFNGDGQVPIVEVNHLYHYDVKR